jgi:energy-coupling factor transporter transmembrane protein EcfT
MLATFQLGEAFLSILWFFMFVLWIMLLFHVFGDLFRDSETSGFAKFLWIMFLIFLPFLGVFVYVIARGSGMQQRSIDAAKANEAAFKDYVQQAAGTGSSTDELAKLAQLKESGVLTDAEFEAQKAKILAG